MDQIESRIDTIRAAIKEQKRHLSDRIEEIEAKKKSWSKNRPFRRDFNGIGRDEGGC